MALGVYLRKNVIDHMHRENDVCFDAGNFGKFTLTRDPDADIDSLYPKKFIYEPSGLLAQLSQTKTPTVTSQQAITRPLDIARLTRLARVDNAGALKKNLECLASHLV